MYILSVVTGSIIIIRVQLCRDVHFM